MKKILLFAAAITIGSLSGMAQPETKGALFSTGGSFMAPGNKVKFGFYRSGSNDVVLLDSIPGDFSNSVVQGGIYGYYHVGRAGGHPDGGDRVYRYNLTTGQVVDSTDELPGIARMAITHDHLVLTFGYGATGNSRVKFIDRYDLSNIVYEDTTIQASTAGVATGPGKVYVAYTENNEGRIAVFSSDTVALIGTIQLDSLSSGLKDIYVDGNNIVGLNSRYDNMFNLLYSGITVIDLTNSTFITDTMGVYLSGIGVENGLFYGNLGAPVQTYDLATQSIGQLFSYFFSAGAKVPGDTIFFLQSTDYWSYGMFDVVSSSGNVIYSANTDISGSAVNTVVNRPPFAYDFMHTVDLSLPNIPPFDLAGMSSDPDSDSLFVDSILQEPAYGTYTISNGVLTYNPTQSTTNDTIIYLISDPWGATDTGAVYLTFITGIGQTAANDAIFVYPNPVNDQLNIDVTMSGRYDLFDISGSLIRSGKLNKGQNLLDVRNLANGIYLINATTGRSVVIKQFVKN